MAGPSRTYWRKDQPHVPVERTRINSYGKPETYLEWDLYLANHAIGQHIMNTSGVCVENPGMDLDYYAHGPEHGYGGPQISGYSPPPPVSNNWTPSRITTLAWYDASDSSTITKNSSNEVTEWADKSGNNNNVTGVDDPITGASTQNSLNVIDHDGGAFFELDDLSTPTSGNLQAFIVCNVTAVDNNWDSILAMDASSNDWTLQAGRNGSFQGAISFTNQPNATTGTGGTNLSGYHIYCADLDFTVDSQYQLLLDGELIANQRTYNSKLASTVDFKIFANRAENRFPEGSVAEVILLDNTDNLTRQKVEGYLAHKWGLTGLLSSTHPYKSVSPKLSDTPPVTEYSTFPMTLPAILA